MGVVAGLGPEALVNHSSTRRYPFRGLRNGAPRKVWTLCSPAMMFSAVHGTLWSGNQVFISDGASVCGNR